MRMISKILRMDFSWRILALIIIALVVHTPAHAGMFDQLKNKYLEVEAGLKSALNNGLAKDSSATEQADVIQAELEFREDWIKETVTEPVFGGDLFVLQTGLEHQQTVVLIHGLGQVGSKDWIQVIPALEKHFHVLALDLPGFGHSAVPSGKYSPTNYAKLINWLVSKYAKGSVYVVGHSMGGAVALRYAASYPDQVSKLVMVDAAGILERTAFLKHTAKIPIDVYRAPKAVQKLSTQVVDLGGSIIELFSQAPDPTPILNRSNKAWNKVFAGRPNANAAMALIEENFSVAIKTLPFHTTLIWGRKDPVAPLRTGHLLVGRLPSAELKVIEDAGHVPMNSHAQVFNTLLMEALTNSAENGLSTDGNFLEQQGSGTLESEVQGKILLCNNENGKVYTGNYASILMKKCHGIRLENVTTKKLHVEDSVIELLNTKVNSDESAVTAVESVVVATNSDFTGRVGILSDGSRFDLAGVSVKGDKYAVKVRARSRFVVSVSDFESPIFKGFIHDVYKAKKTALDNKLMKHK